MQEIPQTKPVTARWVSALTSATVFLFVAAGCDQPCEQLVNTLCSEWNNPEKCEEWRLVASQAGSESCEASLKRLNNRAP